MSEGVGRRAFLGAAAVAPLAAPMAAQMGFGAPDAPYPTPAYPLNLSGSVLGQVAQEMASRALGPVKMPWVLRGLTEEAWKTLQQERRVLAAQLEYRYGRPDLNIESMKSWSPNFKYSMNEMVKNDLRILLDNINAKLEKGSLLDPA